MVLGSKSNDFESLVSKLPGSWQYYFGLGLRYFIREQDPDEVSFVRLNNGYAIEVKTDEDNVDGAEDFWLEFVDGKI